jgi:hypothetical protein
MNAKQIEPEVTEEEYRDFLTECYGIIDVCGYKYDAGYALQELDPIAFRVGKGDYESEMEERWECSVCNEQYNDEDSAEECCVKEESDEG